ncbi:DUF389 domain-containing protein [Demequina salsinemoris]|uniref:DUF389 domain-containing protein n=1 Tax=Demequina salsinemoris TaxID=577470 RepID=UPI000785C9B5|nr:DUF389 domain-containing protein [Demequina salsinemoris]
MTGDTKDDGRSDAPTDASSRPPADASSTPPATPPTGAIPSLSSGAPTVGSTVRVTLLSLLNPVALRGVGAALGGATVLLLHDFALTALQAVVAIALLGSALLDIRYVFSGKRRWGRDRNRVYVLIRAILTLAFLGVVGLLAWIESASRFADLNLPSHTGVSLTIWIAGIYVFARSVLVIVQSLRRRAGVHHRALRVASGVVTAALSVMAINSPLATIEGLLVFFAVGGLVLGALLIAWGLRYSDHPERTTLDPYSTTVAEVLWDWIRTSDIGRSQRAELSDSLYFEGDDRLSKLGAWWVMLFLSVAIATYAVLADSTAVVIGAMLVAPLMVPILGLAGALVNGWSHRAGNSVLLVALGASAAILLAYGLASWAPAVVSFDTNTQIISRVNPTALDMLIAIAAGAAGAFATVNSRVSSGIAGVAIAVALVPPLAVVGIALASKRWADAGGALLLFLTNFVAITIAAALVFVLTGFARHKILQRNPWGVAATVAPYVALGAVILVPLAFSSEGALNATAQSREVELIVDDWLGEDSDLLVQSISIDGGEVTVMLVGPDEAPDPADLQTALVDQLNRAISVRVGVTPVEVTILPTVTPSPLRLED